MIILGKILTMVGTILIAYAALKVHHRFLREHKIDNKVFKTMRREQILGVFGVIIMTIGSLIEISAIL